MTLPGSGAISSAAILAELGRGGPLNIPGDADVQALVGKSSNITVPNDFWGKSSAPPLSLSKDGDVGGFAAPGVGATTSPVTTTPSGGTPGYTYAWSHVSGSGFGVTSPTSATTTFVDGGSNSFGVYRCTVTDAHGATAYVDVNITTVHF